MKSEYVGSEKADKDVAARICSTLNNDGSCRLEMGAGSDELLTICLSAIIFKLLESQKEDLIIDACEGARMMLGNK